jgi:uracil-DNA glycosylase
MTWKEVIKGGWYEELAPFIESGGLDSIYSYLASRLKMGKTLYPSSENVFKAFELTPFNQVRVVIVGQDPYHTPGMAQGLCFSVPEETLRLPPSLNNIKKELEEDVGTMKLELSDLTSWAEQGVLMLNTALTVERGCPGIHSKLWAPFTEEVFKVLRQRPAIVYILWGNHAKQYIPLIEQETNFILTAAHPSPFSAHKGFFGCKHFTKTNQILTEVGKSLDEYDYTITW